MTVPVMAKDEGREALATYLTWLRECLEEGWTDWKAFLAGNPKAANFRATTRANMVYDYTVAAAERKFEKDPNVHISSKRGFTTLTFTSPRIIVLRFKKYRSRRLKTSGIPTRQRIAFEEQRIALDGMDITNLVAGYVLDTLGTKQIMLAISCPLGSDVLWSINLEDEAMATVQPVYELPLDDGPAIRSKKPKKTKQDNAEGQ